MGWNSAGFQSNQGVHQMIHFPLWLMECQSVKLPAAVFGWNENLQSLGPLWPLPAPYSDDNAHTNTDDFLFLFFCIKMAS